jgi:pyruvate dehydrogenase E1 component alpha subunit
MKKDPIPRFETALKEMGVITDADIATMKQEIGAKVEAAVKFSEESPWPALSEILDDVYTGGPVAV